LVKEIKRRIKLNDRKLDNNRKQEMDCDDDCSGRLDCKNKRVQKCPWKKVEVRHTNDGKGSSLFAMEDIEKMSMS
jgi:hypothetical protein